jgi:hypothetical protein
MINVPTPPLWGSPSPAEPTARPVVPDAPQSSWRLYLSEGPQGEKPPFVGLPGVITGTEQDAMGRLVEIAVKAAETSKYASGGYQVARVGTSLVVRFQNQKWGTTRQYQLTAAQILVTTPSFKEPGTF